MPAATAAATAASSSSEAPPPRLRLITEGPAGLCWTTQSMTGDHVGERSRPRRSPAPGPDTRLTPLATPYVRPPMVPATWVPCPATQSLALAVGGTRRSKSRVPRCSPAHRTGCGWPGSRCRSRRPSHPHRSAGSRTPGPAATTSGRSGPAPRAARAGCRWRGPDRPARRPRPAGRPAPRPPGPGVSSALKPSSTRRNSWSTSPPLSSTSSAAAAVTRPLVVVTR